MMICTSKGFIPLANVVRIELEEGNYGGRNVVWYRDGDELTSAEHWYGLNEFGLLNAPVIPASPGFRCVYVDLKRNQTWTMPVIGWRVTNEFAAPIEIGDQCPDWANEKAIVCPTGEVIDHQGIVYESLDAWISERKQKQAQGEREEVINRCVA